MTIRPKTCGECRFTEKAGDTVVWCYGLPPGVIEATQAENGGTQVKIQAVPLLNKDRRGCGIGEKKPRR